MQVYRVENVVAVNPTAIKNALKQETTDIPKPIKKIDALQGIDLSSAGVVIVDYLPESQSNDAQTDDEDLESDDGFQQVMTKKGKKAEKLKAAQAAAAAAALASSANNRTNYNNNRKARDLKQHSSRAYSSQAKIVEKSQSGERKKTSVSVPIPSLFSANIKPMLIPAMLEQNISGKTASAHTKLTHKDFMTNIETWNNELVTSSSNSPNKDTAEKPKYNQVVNNNISNSIAVEKVCSEETSPKLASSKSTHDCGPLSPSVDLNLKIESCKKVWEQTTDITKTKKPLETNTTNISSTTNKKQPLMSIQVKRTDSLKTLSSSLSSASKDVPSNITKIIPVTVAERTSSVTVTSTMSQASTASAINTKNVCTVKPNVSTVKPVQQPSSSLPPSHVAAITAGVTTDSVDHEVSSVRSDENERSPMVLSPTISASVTSSASKSKLYFCY